MTLEHDAVTEPVHQQGARARPALDHHLVRVLRGQELHVVDHGDSDFSLLEHIEDAAGGVHALLNGRVDEEHHSPGGFQDLNLFSRLGPVAHHRHPLGARGQVNLALGRSEVLEAHNCHGARQRVLLQLAKGGQHAHIDVLQPLDVPAALLVIHTGHLRQEDAVRGGDVLERHPNHKLARQLLVQALPLLEVFQRHHREDGPIAM
mmetsp:Transcript_39009/g.65555  ORF Transcript_39009/g.65555 Transcript_39009/m.65555 type:complete len:205 (+) Transcript_39009:254-868(+)